MRFVLMRRSRLLKVLGVSAVISASSNELFCAGFVAVGRHPSSVAAMTTPTTQLMMEKPKPGVCKESTGKGLSISSRKSCSEATSSQKTGPLYVSLSTPEIAGSSDRAPARRGEVATSSFLDDLLDGSYLGPRVALAVLACFYATNFPLGTIMADAFPSPSAVTSARMLLAALALSPNLLKIDPALRLPAVLTGCFTAMGYITQSFSLAMGTSPATVSFLGTAIVLVCPFLEWAVDRKPMSLREAPQTWLAAFLCIAGVGMLELWDPAVGSIAWNAGTGGIGMGDAMALLQAVGFGTQVYLCEKLVRGRPDQTLPVTATLIATTAFLSCLWSFVDGWMFQPGGMAFTLPQLFFEPLLQQVAMCVLWTGLVSTALSLFLEMSALARVSSPEAAVILATEPMWAAVFAAFWLGETFGVNDIVGGALMVLACLANALNPSDFEFVLGKQDDEISDKVGEQHSPTAIAEEPPSGALQPPHTW